MQTNKTLLLLRGGAAAPTTAAAEIAAMEEAKALGFRVLFVRGGMDGLLDERIFTYIASEPGADFRPGGHAGTTRTDVLFEYGKKEWARIGEVLAAHGVTDVLVLGDREGSGISRRLALEFPSLRVAYLPMDVTNGVDGTHHALGYGSGCKKVAADCTEIALSVSSVYGENPGGVYELPETESGWLALSAALGDRPDGSAAEMQFIPEVPFDLGDMVMSAIFCLRDTGKCLIVHSHGLRRKDGSPVYSDESMVHDQYGGGYREDMNSYVADHLRSVTSFAFSYRADVTLSAFTRVLSAFDKAESEAAAVFAVRTLAEKECSFGVSLPQPGGEMKVQPLESFAPLKSVPSQFYSEAAKKATREYEAYARPLTLGEAAAPMQSGIPLYGQIRSEESEKLLPPVEKKVGFILADHYDR